MSLQPAVIFAFTCVEVVRDDVNLPISMSGDY
jgi:hypothetical protein